jgi:hypothetical protein
MDISQYKIKVVAGRATLINPNEKYGSSGMRETINHYWQEFEQFATENSFSTDAPDTKPGESYSGSEFEDEVWQYEVDKKQWTNAFNNINNQQRYAGGYSKYKDGMARGYVETRRFRSFIGQPKGVEKETWLIPGDRVIMINCGEADRYKGVVWECSSKSYPAKGGDIVVHLKGFAGCFLCACLEKTDKPLTSVHLNSEKVKTIFDKNVEVSEQPKTLAAQLQTLQKLYDEQEAVFEPIENENILLKAKVQQLAAQLKEAREENERLKSTIKNHESHFTKERHSDGAYLQKNNDNREWSAEAWINEFYEFLKTGEAESIYVEHKPLLNEKQAFSVIWYLQEHFPLLPDNIDQCDVCKDLYNSNSCGYYSEKGNEHGNSFCGACDYLAPFDDDENTDEEDLLPEPPKE